MSRLFRLAFLTVSFVSVISCCRSFTGYVDTRMGSDSRFELSKGNTYPGTGRPFGVHLWSPQTGVDGSGWKYVWRSETICGFALSHQCSPWTGDYGSISLFPEAGDSLVLASQARGARFSHRDETARAECYDVIFQNGISTEIAPTERCCCIRFRFPKDGRKANILLDLWRNPGIVEESAGRITGYVNIWGRSDFKNYFTLEFSRPFESFAQYKEGPESGAHISFPAGSEVVVKIGTSYISPEQAELNLKREIGEKSFNAVKREGRKVWNETLGQVAVSGGKKEDIRTFYTCLYRASLNSRMFYEEGADGQPIYFSPYDFKVHGGYMYTDNGFWDSYHAQFPLFNILHPTLQGRYMNALLDAYDQLGWLPSWSQPCETGGMSGNHSISLFADAWAKGIRTFSPERVMDAYAHEITAKGPYGLSNGRYGTDHYWNLGYVPYPECKHGTTLTLEYAYDDWCGGIFARETGSKEWMEKLDRSSGNWRNVFCPEVGFMRGRAADGSWTPDFKPGSWGGPYEECNAWQQTFSVLHDIPSMIRAYGGEDAFCSKLDALFSTPPIIDFGFYDDIWNEMVEMVVADTGMYNHGNQPNHHIPYLYVYGGQPWKTQYRVRDIMERLYKCAPDGYPGDDDQGAMSAWYVMSALGLYSICPGSTEYVLGSPLFRRAVIRLENGKKFTVIAEGNGENDIYVRSAAIDGRRIDKMFIDHSDILAGSTLILKMADNPASN